MKLPRSIKKFIALLVYLVIFFLLGWLIYSWIKPAPNCYDQKQNQEELGIDCGGPCQVCQEIPQIKSLAVKEKYFIYGGPGKYDLFAKIYNPNEQYGNSEFSYTFILKDSSGNVISERKGSSFILPSESKNLIELGLELQNPPATFELSISDGDNWKKFTGYEEPQLNIYNKRYNLITSGTGFSEVYALMRNQSPFDFNTIKISIVLRDPSGMPVAVNTTEMNTVNSNEERDFRLVWPFSFLGEVRTVEVEAEANVFDTDNFMKKYLPGGKFQR